ncbi:MAG: CBS domain-containing protein [Proteobacteria bacterium]|nr:CBS domain-containing protein [Pseudomonadota bacterium]
MTEDQSINGSEQGVQKSWLAKIANMFKDKPKNREDLVKTLVESHSNGLLDIDALNMMKGALKVSELQVRQVMIPRAQMVVIPKVSSMDEILPIIVESGHSRFPVVGEDKDELEGILLAKDLLKFFVDHQQNFKLSELIRPAIVIPESKQVNILLNEFRTRRNHMAIVIDEYGGVAGLVTIEDILEEIVGEIDDEFDGQEDPYILKTKENTYRINALTTIEDFNKHFNFDFNNSEFDTIGGLIASFAGRLPETGEIIKIAGMSFLIAKADKRKIEFIEIEVST